MAHPTWHHAHVRLWKSKVDSLLKTCMMKFHPCFSIVLIFTCKHRFIFHSTPKPSIYFPYLFLLFYTGENICSICFTAHCACTKWHMTNTILNPESWSETVCCAPHLTVSPVSSASPEEARGTPVRLRLQEEAAGQDPRRGDQAGRGEVWGVQRAGREEHVQLSGERRESWHTCPCVMFPTHLVLILVALMQIWHCGLQREEVTVVNAWPIATSNNILGSLDSESTAAKITYHLYHIFQMTWLIMHICLI